jgi:hypothetical protein
MRIIKLLAALLVIGALGLLGYAYFGDMTPPQREITIDVPVPGG